MTFACTALTIQVPERWAASLYRETRQEISRIQSQPASIQGRGPTP